jgi:hypothetical protein
LRSHLVFGEDINSPQWFLPANLIELLKEYGDSIEGFADRVGDDFARGHKEATGGIIARVCREATGSRNQNADLTY